MRKRPLSITLSDYNRALLSALADRHDRSLSYIIGWAVERMSENIDLGLGDDKLNKLRDKYDMVKPGEEDYESPDAARS